MFFHLILCVYLGIVESRKYHTTRNLLELAESHCYGPLECRWDSGVLLMDWNSPSEKRVVLNFNEHARERITGELALGMIERIHDWQPSVDVTIVPVLNVWGREQVDKGRTCLRKTKNGVDPNRNYQTEHNRRHYAKHSSEYEGPSPLSETTSKLIARELEKCNRYINVHSGEFSLYTPFDSRTYSPPNEQNMLHKVHHWHKYCRECTVGPAASTSFYKAYGTSVDWATDHGVEEAYTFEIYGENSVDCDRMFNPPEHKLDEIIQKWLPILKDAVYANH